MHSMYGARGHVHGNESGPRGPGSVILATILVKLSMALMRATFHRKSHRTGAWYCQYCLVCKVWVT